MQDFDFDLFVIGAGSGGVRACRIAASLGARVAVAEERYFGGTCVNVGCVPKKLFSYAAHYRDDFRDSQGFGWQQSVPGFDWAALKSNKDREIKRLNGIYESILKDNKVEIFSERAVLQGKNAVRVGGKVVTAKYILIAVGGWPWIPEFPGSDLAISSNEIFAMEALPDSMVIVGGGYIAVEFASIFSRLGCKTTLLYRGDKLLRGFDEEVRRFITAEISHELDVRLQCNLREISKAGSDNTRLTAHLENGDKIKASAVLYATGRKPATQNLGVEQLGLQLADNGALQVNDKFKTNIDNVYAIGDVIDRVALTPVALAEGEIVARRLFADTSPDDMSYANIPTAVFCHPNIATVGLSEQEALAQGLDVDVYSSQMRPLKHTLSGSHERSLVKLIVDKVSDRVIGLHMVGPDAGEVVQGFAVAMNCGATKADFDRTIGIHPTLAEEFVTMRGRRGGT